MACRALIFELEIASCFFGVAHFALYPSVSELVYVVVSDDIASTLHTLERHESEAFLSLCLPLGSLVFLSEMMAMSTISPYRSKYERNSFIERSLGSPPMKILRFSCVFLSFGGAGGRFCSLGLAAFRSNFFPFITCWSSRALR